MKLAQPEEVMFEQTWEGRLFQGRGDRPNESLGQEGMGLIQELDEGQCGWSTEWVE